MRAQYFRPGRNDFGEQLLRIDTYLRLEKKEI